MKTKETETTNVNKTNSIANEMFQTTLKKLLQRTTKNRFFRTNFKNNLIRSKILKNYVYTLCSVLKLNQSTCALTIALLDQLISRTEIKPEKFILVSAVVFNLIIKFNETELYSYELILRWFNLENVPMEEIRNIEKIVLNQNDFKINLKTPWHILGYFILLENMENQSNQIRNCEKKTKKKFDLVYKIYQIICLDYHANKFTSVSIAAVVLMIANKLAGNHILISKNIQKLFVNFQEDFLMLYFHYLRKVQILIRTL